MHEGEYMLRPAVDVDGPLLLELILEFAAFVGSSGKVTITAERLHESLFVKRQAEALLLFHGAAPAGYALFYPDYSSWSGLASMYLEDLYIREEHRRGGVGAMVFARLASLCRERGYEAMGWYCRDWNTNAIAFYQKMGAERQEGFGVYRLDAAGLARLAGE